MLDGSSLEDSVERERAEINTGERQNTKITSEGTQASWIQVREHRNEHIDYNNPDTMNKTADPLMRNSYCEAIMETPYSGLVAPAEVTEVTVNDCSHRNDCSHGGDQSVQHAHNAPTQGRFGLSKNP